MLFSMYASQGAKGSAQQLSFVDVKKAYFNGVPRRTLFVRFPREANGSHHGLRQGSPLSGGCVSAGLASQPRPLSDVTRRPSERQAEAH